GGGGRAVAARRARGGHRGGEVGRGNRGGTVCWASSRRRVVASIIGPLAFTAAGAAQVSAAGDDQLTGAVVVSGAAARAPEHEGLDQAAVGQTQLGPGRIERKAGSQR